MSSKDDLWRQLNGSKGPSYSAITEYMRKYPNCSFVTAVYNLEKGGTNMINDLDEGVEMINAILESLD